MQNSSNRRAGPWLVLLCLAATAGTLYWVWKRVEPDVRYRRICSAIRLHLTNPGGPESASLGNRLWANLAWFSEHSKEALQDRLFQSLLSTRPDEREDAAILAANLDQWEEGRVLGVRGIPFFPAATETSPGVLRFRIGGAIKRQPEVLRHMAADERRLVRACFLDLIWEHPDPFRKQVAEIALKDPDIDMRLQAVPLLWHGLFQDHDAQRQLAKDANPRVRLRATCLLAVYGRSLEALQDCILLLADPDVALPAQERISAIESFDAYSALADRCEETKRASETSPEVLRVVAEKWKAWFQSKDFEAFAAEFSKSR